MKNFDWDAPVSRKDYAVLYGWSFGIAMVMLTIGMAITYWTEIKDWTVRKVKKVRSWFPW